MRFFSLRNLMFAIFKNVSSTERKAGFEDDVVVILFRLRHVVDYIPYPVLKFTSRVL